MSPDPAAQRVIIALGRAGQSVATAESLTGGLLAAALTSVPGASAVVRGGVVAYATDLKAHLLGVHADLLASHGPVDADVARAMADGVARLCGATYGVATTGVAGPQPQGGQAVGTVFVAAYGPRGAAVSALTLDGDRDRIRVGTVDAALELLLRLIVDPD